jgi:homogentisate 1,2-dioxygenase
MPIYHRLGDIPKKRHTVFRRPDGGLYAEELMGHEGFVGTSSLLYHTYPPTTVKSAKKIREIRWEAPRRESQIINHRVEKSFLSRTVQNLRQGARSAATRNGAE